MAAITSIVSLNQLVTWFEAFADNHFFLKDFGFGEPYDIGTTRQMEFPYMWLTLDDTSVIATGTNVKSAIPDYSFRVFFMDKINIQENYLDQNGFQSDNSQEIISDTIQYLQDLITEIQQNWGQYGVLLSADVTFSPVIDETQDKATGISASITLRTRQVNCVIPEAPTNIIVQPNQPVYETLLTCETLEDCSTFQTYAYTGGTFTGSTLTLKSLNNSSIAITGFTGGGSGTSGTSGTSGVGGSTGYWGAWYSNIDQTISLAGQASAMTVNQLTGNLGITIQGGLPGSKIIIPETGTYNIEFSAQLHYTGGGGSGKNVEIWFRKNNIDIPDSNTKVVVDSNSNYVVAAWNYMDSFNSGDTIEIMWTTNNTNIIIEHAVSGSTPAIPSVILTINQIAYQGISGTNGTSGSSGVNGTNGSNGTNGTSGTTPANPITLAAGSPTTISYVWSGTQAQYNALTPNANTLYFIV